MQVPCENSLKTDVKEARQTCVGEKASYDRVSSNVDNAITFSAFRSSYAYLYGAFPGVTKMIDAEQKHGIEPLALRKLEDALAEFIIMNPARNPATAREIEHTERIVRVGMNRAGENGTAVMAAAQALLKFIRSSPSQ